MAIVLIFATLLVAPALSDPITEIVQTSGPRPIAYFRSTPDGGEIHWWVPTVPGDLVPPPDGYSVYRSILVDNRLNAVGDVGVEIGFVSYHTGDQFYSFTDTAYAKGSVVVYYVRAVFGESEGPPSNPVSDYPYCDWVSLPDGHVHPECLIPTV
ncbi:MAG: hypothetical protein ABR562_07245 [Thermoplasmatota archaeon]